MNATPVNRDAAAVQLVGERSSGRPTRHLICPAIHDLERVDADSRSPGHLRRVSGSKPPSNGPRRRLDALKPHTNRVLTKMDRIGEGPLGCVSAGQGPFSCSPGWTRTNNPPINSRMLCQLSYRGSRPQTLATRRRVAKSGAFRRSPPRPGPRAAPVRPPRRRPDPVDPGRRRRRASRSPGHRRGCVGR
jgi:hypothetical protein